MTVSKTGSISPLDPASSEPFYRQIYTRFRGAIAGGVLKPGDRIPSARALTEELGLARGTIEAAYSLLAAEGYIQARGQAGTIVTPGLTPRTPAPNMSPRPDAGTPSFRPDSILPFQMGLPALDMFPRKVWARLGARSARAMQPSDMVHPPVYGLPALRAEIAAYLQVSRGIDCSPSQVFVTSGYRQTIALISHALLKTGDRVWLEDPGYPPTREMLSLLQMRPVSVPVDQDGLIVAEGVKAAPTARAAVVTPAHQSPLCVSLSLPRRLALLLLKDASEPIQQNLGERMAFAYMRAVRSFLLWRGVAGMASLREVRPLHVAAYIKECGSVVSAPTVKQRLAALRSLFDWLVRTGVLESNPVHAVRGPSHEVVRGKTPILSPQEARRLLESIPADNVVGLRDRALIALMTYSFARVSAAVGMKVEDLVQTAGRSWVRLHERRGKVHELPIHHKLLDHLDAYLAAAGHRVDAKAPLFRSARGRTGELTDRSMSRHDAYAMVRRRASAAGLQAKIGNHSFRGTGITTFLLNEGTLELAQEMANHSSPRTTKLYDRRKDKITQDAIERIRIEL